MKIKITGQFFNGTPYVAVIPKESLTTVEAQALLDSETWKLNTSTSDGIGLDTDNLTAELFDDEIIEDAEISRFKIVLYRSGILSGIESYMATKNGETAIWWNNVKSISYYHSNVQEAINDLDLDIETVKNFFRQAQEIE
jgi:hypothetical protein